jgi:hypothetical protein
MPAAPVILRLLHPVSRPPPFQLFTSFNICPPSIHPSIWPTCSWARGRVTTASAAFFLNPEDKPSRRPEGSRRRNGLKTQAATPVFLVADLSSHSPCRRCLRVCRCRGSNLLSPFALAAAAAAGSSQSLLSQSVKSVN